MADITLNTISKAFGRHMAVDGVSLSINDGEFLTIVGPSGCGKSTLLRIIAGLETGYAGSVSIGGRSVDAMAPKARDLAMVFQSYALYPYMTVGENIAMPLVMRRLNALQRLPLFGRVLPGARRIRRGIEADVAAVADSLGIGQVLRRRPGQLSGGQRQRVALARALVRRPAAFLLDEPLSNLDARMRVQARAEITELHQRLGGTFLYVTHDQAEAMTMSDRVAVMMGGRLLQVDPPQRLYEQPATIEVARFMGTPEINVLPGIVRDWRTIAVLGRPWAVATAASAGDVVSVAVRPEAWTIGGDAGQAVLSGQVRRIEQLGSETLIHVGVDGVDRLMAVRVAPLAGGSCGPGQSVHLGIDPGRVLVFDDQGRRLATESAGLVRPASEPVHG